MKKHLFIAIFGLVLMGCQSDDSTEPGITDPVNIEFTNVAKHELWGAGEEDIVGGNLVINTAEEWQGLLQQITSVNALPENFGDTNIDFSEFTVIAVFDDLQMSGGHYISIESVVQTNTTVIVTVDSSMDDEANVTLIITQPYHIVKIPKTALPVVFE